MAQLLMLRLRHVEHSIDPDMLPLDALSEFDELNVSSVYGGFQISIRFSYFRLRLPVVLIFQECSKSQNTTGNILSRAGKILPKFLKTCYRRQG